MLWVPYNYLKCDEEEMEQEETGEAITSEEGKTVNIPIFDETVNM